MDLSATEAKGEEAYWRAVAAWCAAALLGSAAYSIAPTISVAGKVLIVAALATSVHFVFGASDAARYAAGGLALLGLLANAAAACAVFEGGTRLHGLLAIVLAVYCGLVLHAFLISGDVAAYLRAHRRSRGLSPGA